MKKKFLLCIFVLFLSLTAAHTLQAQELDLRTEIGSGVTLNGFGGVNVFSGIDLGWCFNAHVGMYLDLNYQFAYAGNQYPVGNFTHNFSIIPTVRAFVYTNKILELYLALGLGFAYTRGDPYQEANSPIMTVDELYHTFESKYQLGIDFHIYKRFYLGLAATMNYAFLAFLQDTDYIEKVSKKTLEHRSGEMLTPSSGKTPLSFNFSIVASFRFL